MANKFWDDWVRLTRFLHSGNIALAREDNLWNTLQLSDPADTTINFQRGNTTYTTNVTQHRSAIGDEWLFNASILLHSYALAEAAAGDKLGEQEPDKLGGIEAWGQRLLDKAGKSWDDVLDRKAGIIQVAVVRNLIGHGNRKITQRALNRLDGGNANPGWKTGDEITLDYVALQNYRARIKSLLRLGQI